ncbi:hypothetical protein QQX98_010573 [Neonectria punicea]|uniref:ZZ-type domain-containing protein n=1 Tax=Neonectria punicea TaxID=979145 RepID=A0ABR1GPE9_9HYPO
MDAQSKDDGSSESDALSNISQTSQKSQVPQTDNAPKNPSPTQNAPEQLPQEAEASTQNRTPLPPSRPPHAGWVGTGIPMAICDFCDKRSQGTLQRCSVCKVAICRECLDAGKLDSRHSLDPDSVRWDLHIVQPAEKKPKKTRATTTTTRARGVGRARARGGRATRTVATRASAAAPAAESPAPSHDENMGDMPEQDDELIIIQEHFNTPPARPRQEPMEEVHLRNQVRPRSPMPQLLPSGQPSFIEPPVEPRRGPVPLQFRPLQPILPRPSPYQQARVPLSPRSQAPFPGNAYGSQPRGQDLRGSGSSQGSVAREERGHRYHPYSRTGTLRPPSFQYDDQVLGTLGMGRQGAYNQPQPPRSEHASLQPSLPPLYPAGSETADRSQPGSHPEPFRREYSLPPIRELALYPPRPPTPAHSHLPPPQHYGQQQQHHNQPQQQIQPQHYNQQHHYGQQQHYQQQRHLQHHAPQQPPPRQASADALVQTLSKQLEADALATHRDYPAWPLDQCLRHELDRAWSRRGAHLSLLRAVRGPNGVENTDVAFRILINANYMASVLLQINTPNAAHQWLVDTKKQLVEHGFLAPLPAGSPHN